MALFKNCKSCKNKLINRVEKYVNVDDNWCPNYYGNQIMVRLDLYNEYVRFHAWGADDMGVEMHCPIGSKKVYDIWKENIFDKMPDVVNMNWFLEHGFYSAS